MTDLRKGLLAECYRLGETAALVVNTNESTGVNCLDRMGRLGDVLDRADELGDILGPEAEAAFQDGATATQLSEVELKKACARLRSGR